MPPYLHARTHSCPTRRASVLPASATVPGPPAVCRAVRPSLRRPGETFHFGLKAEDRWGNPSHLAEGRFSLMPSLPVAGLPETLDYRPGERARALEGLSVAEPGDLTIAVYDGNALIAEAGPLLIRDGKHAGYWGDLHGQSGESIGVGASREYFTFARDLSFLDVSSHQAKIGRTSVRESMCQS